MAFEDININTCPYCNKTINGNKGIYANHLRWCKLNPNFENNNNKFKETLSKSLKDKTIKNDYDIICPICGKHFIIHISENQYNIGKYKKTCSSVCAHKLTILNSNNDERIKNISKSINEFNIKNGTKIVEQTKKCKYCNNEYKTLRNTNFCSIKCARLYRSEFQMKDKDSFERYRKLCEFKFGIKSFPEEFKSELLKENGWYSASNHGNNYKGVSRDHMFSCKEGFNQLIDPYLISHPANCNLILQSDNISKYSKCSLTLDNLIKRVKEWNNKYGEYENKINYNLVKDLNIVKWAG